MAVGSPHKLQQQSHTTTLPAADIISSNKSQGAGEQYKMLGTVQDAECMLVCSVKYAACLH